MTTDSARFSVMTDVVQDWRTGLVWQLRPVVMGWQAARDYADRLVLGDRHGWRLPAIEELIGLLDYSCYEPASRFPGLEGKRKWPDFWFWSSTLWVGPTSESEEEVSLVWYANFADGRVWTNHVDNAFMVRCVHPNWGPGG